MTSRQLVAVLALLSAAAFVSESEGSAVSLTPDDKLLPLVRLHPRTTRQRRQALEMNQPIRVLPFYVNNFNSSLGAKSSLVRNTIIPDLLTFLSETLSVAPLSAPILLNNECTGGEFFFQNGQTYCATRCEPVTRCGPFTVPTEHLKRCRQCNGQGFSQANCASGSPAADGPGVTGSDFLLYVTADQSACPTSDAGGAQVVAFATACQQEDMQDRPVAGVVNFCPAGLQDKPDDFAFALTKHEVLHALVISRGLFPFWRDDMNNPRTPRDTNGRPRLDASRNYVISDSTIRSVTYEDWQTRSGRVSHTVMQLVTPAVQREARAHFSCGILQGVELENQGGAGTALNHFEKRVLGNEAMTGQLTFNPVFSRLTYAVLEDSGWYRVNYTSAQPLPWGRGAGCRFAEGSCGEWIQSRTDSNEPLTPFCNEVFTSARRGCTVDREAVSKCNLAMFRSSLAAEYQYYSNDVTGGQVQIADFCGIQDVFRISEGSRVRDTVCSSSSNAPSSNSLLESYGAGSRCVNHGRQWSANSQFISNYGSGCYKYFCSGNVLNIAIADFNITCSCSQANQEMMFDRTVGGVRYLGSILCPACDVICEVSSKVISTGSGSGSDNDSDNGNGGAGVRAAMLLVLAWSLVSSGLLLS